MGQTKGASNTFNKRGNDSGKQERGASSVRPSQALSVPKVINPEQVISAIAEKMRQLNERNGVIEIGGERITPTKNQKKLIHVIPQKSVVLVDGPLGTGKTLWTCYAGLKGMADGTFTNIALTAPAVEADEHLGFLKGDKDEKMEQYVNQILGCIDELIGKNLREKMQDADLLEIAPHAFNRGRTYKKTLYILDESQNATWRQLKTSLGRLGFKSTFVYMGDDAQNDRTSGQSAYVSFVDRFSDAVYKDDIALVTMGLEDVRRHPLLQKMLERDDFREPGTEPSPTAKRLTAVVPLKLEHQA